MDKDYNFFGALGQCLMNICYKLVCQNYNTMLQIVFAYALQSYYPMQCLILKIHTILQWINFFFFEDLYIWIIVTFIKFKIEKSYAARITNNLSF